MHRHPAIAAAGRGLAVLLLAAGALPPGPSAAAQEPGGAGAGDEGAWAFQWENDLFARGRTDRYYTNGLLLVRTGPTAPLSAPAGDGFGERHAQATGRWLCRWLDCDPGATRIARDWRLGQNMYTPQNLVRPSADPWDRPYAGWLYLGHRTRLIDRPDEDGEATRQQALEIDIGVIGPSAGAGAVQRAWHRLIGAVDPRGWPHQLRNEPALLVMHTTTLRRPLGPLADMLPQLRLAAGNVFTYAAVGTQWRLGPDLDGFGHFDPAPSIIPVATRRRGSPYHGFLAVELRAVARNVFIDGNSFRDHPRDEHIARRPLVADATLGFSVRLSDHWRLTYGHTWRSPEFKQDSGAPAGAPRPQVQRYGVIRLQRAD